MAANTRSVFLWGAPPPVPDLQAFNPRSDRWWDQYRASLRVSPSALRELAKSSRDIVALLPDPTDWATRPMPYKGLVVGAVQSGKTASMMGVAAVALDQGYRIVVVLAGGKDDLRQQTARRFNTQLLRQCDEIPNSGGATTLGGVRGAGPLGGFAPPYTLDANQYSLLQLRMERALRKGEPCLVVVKKNTASLRDLQGALQHLYTSFGVEALPILVFDDECDDASVDSVDTTIPAAIANLWRRLDGPTPRAAYVGYTATAAANLLQDAANDLYPSHFVYLLRYPGENETAIQFSDPTPDAWYSGGECFYQAFGEEPGETANFLLSTSVTRGDLAGTVDINPSLLDALRAFFVGGAYRLALDPTRSFADVTQLPRPHTMLVQTSSATNEHVRWAKGIEAVLRGHALGDKVTGFDPKILMEQVLSNEAPWREWYDRIDASRERVYEERPHTGIHRVVTWTEVRDRLPDVFGNTKLKIVNSDPVTGSDLDFAPRRTPSGAAFAPQDIYVIIVGGSKLSRGLTIEGLCVSYFVRWSLNPTEDTVLQMSRWFGFRGQHLEHCRVFTTAGIATSLREMHENDVDLRYQLSELMALGRTPAEATLVIRANPRALPTGKMGDGAVFDLAFSPYTNFLRYTEAGALAAANERATLDLVKQIRARNPENVVTAGGTTRGILSRGWTAEEVVAVLEALAYSAHNPDVEMNPMRDFYRAPSTDRPVGATIPLAHDPYQIAAYLRAWISKGEDAIRLPSFNVGVAFGEMHEGREPFDFDLTNRQVGKDGWVVGGWTGRSATWDGDAFFDRPEKQFRLDGSQLRVEGGSGLLLLYVIHKSATGRNKEGLVRTHHTPVLAVAVPGGGPLFRRVVV